MKISFPLTFATVDAYLHVKVGDVIRILARGASSDDSSAWGEVAEVNQHHVSCTASIRTACGYRFFKTSSAYKLDDASADAWRETQTPYVVGA